MNIKLDKNISTPLYIQIYNKIKTLIKNGDLKEGEKLPSIRSLAEKLNVNNITIVNAYKVLERENLVYSKEGSGTYVSSDSMALNIPYLENESIDLMTSGILTLSKNSINFASVSPTPEVFPVEEFKKVLIEVLDRDKGKAFVYPEINGYTPLRESISNFLKENYTINVHKNQIQITSGGQQGIDIVAKTLIEPGDYVFLENPTYSGAIAAFKSRGANIISIPILEDGLDINTLKEYIKKYHPKFLYIMPNYQSPTTYSYSEENKQKLLEIAYENNLFIIEDDFLSDLNYSDKKKLPLKAMDTLDQVIYIKSFSKIFMPGIRIGFLTVPKILLKDIIKAKHITDISSSGFIQRAFDLYLRKDLWRSHIEHIISVYSKKYNLMVKEAKKLKKHGITFTEPKGGLSLWLKLPEDINPFELYDDCVKNNVIIVPGEMFYANKNIKDKNYIRISFGAVNEEQIIEGIRVIYNCIGKNNIDNNAKYIPFI